MDLNAIGHSPTDWIGNETSSDLTPAILDSQSQQLNSAYDQVFSFPNWKMVK